MRNWVPFDRQTRAEALAVYLLAFLFLPLASIAAAQIWVLAVVAALAVAVARLRRGTLLQLSVGPLAMLLAMLAIWGALTAVWSIAPERSIATAGRLFLVAVCITVLIQAAIDLDPEERRHCARFLAAGTAFGIVVILVEVVTSGAIAVLLDSEAQLGHELDRLNRTGSVVAMLVWPAALVTAQLYGRYRAAAVIAFCAIVLVIVAPRSPLVAFVIGSGAFAVGWLSQRWGKRFLLAGFLVAVVIVPFLDAITTPIVDFLVANVAAPNSEVHRLRVWEFASSRILERPLGGWGLDTARVVPGSDQMLPLFAHGTGPIVTGKAIPLHPHNALIQVWLELGLVGVLVVAGLFVLIVAAIPESTRNHAGPAVAIAAAATGFAVAELGFGIWQGWWMAALGVTAVIVTATVTSRIVEPIDAADAVSGRIEET
jgi:exopolysaccharide production protein ExoQ